MQDYVKPRTHHPLRPVDQVPALLISILQPEDVTSLLTLKMALKYAQLREVECMRAVARAHQNRNLADFEKALKDYKDGQPY